MRLYTIITREYYDGTGQYLELPGVTVLTSAVSLFEYLLRHYNDKEKAVSYGVEFCLNTNFAEHPGCPTDHVRIISVILRCLPGRCTRDVDRGGVRSIVSEEVINRAVNSWIRRDDGVGTVKVETYIPGVEENIGELSPHRGVACEGPPSLVE